MDTIINGTIQAFHLILSGDKALYGIIFLSVAVSLLATIIASVIALPCGIFLGLKEYKGKHIVGRLLYTFMSVPSVIVGLLVAIFFAGNGPIGFLQLMYTPAIMVIAQTFLLLPLFMGLFFNLAKSNGKIVEQIGTTLGANFFEKIILVTRELKFFVYVAVVTGFSRAISEVGAVSIVGGNIENHTRVMTTAIIMYQSMGDYEIAIALGIILLLISLIMNSVLYKYES